MSNPSSGSRTADGASRQLTVSLQEFAWQALELESDRLGVSVAGVVEFAIAYYLADLDSGRIARRSTVPRPPGATQRRRTDPT